MSLPPIPRPSTSLPPLKHIAREPVAPRIAPEPEYFLPEETVVTGPEILVITVDDDPSDPKAISVAFEAAGFDVSQDEIVLDILRLAVNSYGFDIVEID